MTLKPPKSASPTLCTLTRLQFYNDDFYNTDFWHDMILDLTLVLWTLAAAEVLLCLLQVMVLWCCIVLLVCVWVVLLCLPSYTCINEQDPNQYTNKILTLSCKPYVREIFKIQMWIHSTFMNKTQSNIHTKYLHCPAKIHVRDDIQIKIQTLIMHTLL